MSIQWLQWSIWKSRNSTSFAIKLSWRSCCWEGSNKANEVGRTYWAVPFLLALLNYLRSTVHRDKSPARTYRAARDPPAASQIYQIVERRCLWIISVHIYRKILAFVIRVFYRKWVKSSLKQNRLIDNIYSSLGSLSIRSKIRLEFRIELSFSSTQRGFFLGPSLGLMRENKTLLEHESAKKHDALLN
jgi:hypothetical protein